MGKGKGGWLFYFVTFLFIVKIAFAILAITHMYLKRTGKEDTPVDELIVFWKKRCEFVFIIGISLLSMFFFFPWRKVYAKPSFEMRLLFFFYSIIILINLDWEIVIGDSLVLDTVQKIV